MQAIRKKQTQRQQENVCQLVLQIIVAEVLGTAMLLFVGCSYDIYSSNYAWTFPMAMVIAIHIFGPSSGAHVNPGATIVAYLLGQISHTPLVFVYWAAQFCGGFLGYALYYEVSLSGVDVEYSTMCVTKPPEEMEGVGTSGKTFGLELLMSFVFFLATAARFDPHNKLLKGAESIKMGFIAFGLYYSMSMSLWLSMNTARSLPPAVFTGDYEGQWIYWVAPNLAALIAGGTYRLCLTSRAFLEPESTDIQTDNQT